MQEKLVPIKTSHPKLKTLGVCHRIEIEHPMLIRESVFKKLTAAANRLPGKFMLQVDSGYRSRETQEKLHKARTLQFGNKKNADKLVFNPAKGIPPHSTGGAVDVTLTDQKGREINLSSPLDKFYVEPKLYSNKISPEAQQLRILLHNIMIQENFAPHPNEYWHFSYGDLLWSKHYGKSIIYDEIPKSQAPRYPFFIIHYIKICKHLRKLGIKTGMIKTNY